MGRKLEGHWQGKVHEVWKINGKLGKLNNTLLHYPHPTLFSFIEHIGRYAYIHSLQKLEKGETSSLVKIIFYPPLKFIFNILIKGGYKDGTYGFVYALLMSFHSFISWSMLWMIKYSKE